MARPKIIVTEKMRRQIADGVAAIDLTHTLSRRHATAERVRRAADMLDAAQRVDPNGFVSQSRAEQSQRAAYDCSRRRPPNGCAHSG